MWKKIAVFGLVAGLVLPYVSFAFDYDYKKIDDFETLESCKTVAEFELIYGKYVQDCLDNTGGGTGGIQCLIGFYLWDREMNIYYNRLMKTLGKKEKDLLRESQRAWIRARQRTIAFNSALLDRKYAGEVGTAYMLMRAYDAEEVVTPIVKQRALLLKGWLEFRQKGHVN